MHFWPFFFIVDAAYDVSCTRAAITTTAVVDEYNHPRVYTRDSTSYVLSDEFQSGFYPIPRGRTQRKWSRSGDVLEI